MSTWVFWGLFFALYSLGIGATVSLILWLHTMYKLNKQNKKDLKQEKASEKLTFPKQNIKWYVLTTKGNTHFEVFGSLEHCMQETLLKFCSQLKQQNKNIDLACDCFVAGNLTRTLNELSGFTIFSMLAPISRDRLEVARHAKLHFNVYKNFRLRNINHSEIEVLFERS